MQRLLSKLSPLIFVLVALICVCTVGFLEIWASQIGIGLLRGFQSALTLIGSISAWSAKQHWAKQQEVSQDAEELRQGLNKFERWLESAVRNLNNERSNVSLDIAKRGLRHTTRYATKYGEVFLDWSLGIREKWISDVADLRDSLLVLAHVTSLKGIDLELAELQDRIRDNLYEVLLQQRDKTRQELAIADVSSIGLADCFDSYLQKQNVDIIIGTFGK